MRQPRPAEGRLPRLLVLSTSLPGSRHGGGVVMDEVLRHYPADRYVCFAARWPDGWQPGEPLPASVGRVPHRVVPLVPSVRTRGARFYMPAVRAIALRCVAPHCARQAVAFGRRHAVDAVWAELQGESLFLAGQVARELALPLIGTVWDDPAGWLADGGYDRWSRELARQRFREALRSAHSLSTAGEAMQQAYLDQHGARSVILRHGFASHAPPPTRRNDPGAFTVGFVGSTYGRDAWRAFVAAAASLNRSGNCPRVELRAFGVGPPPVAHPDVPVQVRGWQPADVMLSAIAETDLCYLPYWFARGKRRHVELSFPNKFETYVAAGRPVFFHGPEYAGVAEAVRSYGVGVCVHTLDPAAVAEELARLIADPALRDSFSGAALSAFHAEFNATVMVRNFAELIGVSPGSLTARSLE